MATPKPKPKMGTNPKPKLTSTFTPEQLAYYKSVKAKQKEVADQIAQAEKEKAAYDKAMANEVARRNRAEMYRKKTKEEKAIIKEQQTKEELAHRRWQERSS
jgi:hypothetical protein